MQVADSRMTASVGLRMAGSGRSSTRTSPGADMTATRIGGISSNVVWRVGLKTTPLRDTKGVPVETCTNGAPQLPPARRTVDPVDNRAEVREFLISRRAKVTPKQAGLPDIG